MANTSEIEKTLPSLSRDLADVVEQVGPAVVAVNARRHLSSTGVYWREGVIVTAAHTLRRTEDISVILANGQTVATKFAGADPSTDLAVLKVNAADLSAPRFGDTAELKVGHMVLAVGRGAQRGLNATLGIVGVLSGKWRSWRGGLIDQFIGLDLVLHPGAAGGPLLDAHGRVLGINTSGLSRNMALTVPASTVNHVIAHLLERNAVDGRKDQVANVFHHHEAALRLAAQPGDRQPLRLQSSLELIVALNFERRLHLAQAFVAVLGGLALEFFHH